MGECEKCHGSGKIVCPVCDGNKEIKCENCGGHGQFADCRECGNTGKTDCTLCDGTGKYVEACRVCHGTGKVPATRWINCKTCHGSGIKDGRKCYSCGGSGQVKESYREYCPNCKGKGHVWDYSRSCRMCEGTGKVMCSRCRGTRHAICEECYGSGKVDCKKCRGKGEIRCPDCEKKEQEERNRRIAAREKREAAEKAAKERRDAIQGCGCLLAIAAVIGFFVWWWWEGMTMSALPGMWKQTKGVLGESGWGIAGKVAGSIVALVIGWCLIRSIKGKKGEISTSSKKRWKFVVLGILLGAFGVHLAYAKRWFLFLLLWTGFITGNVMTPTKPNSGENPAEATAQQVEPADKAGKDGGSPISGVGFGVWALLWIGGTLFIKKDGKGNRM